MILTNVFNKLSVKEFLSKMNIDVTLDEIKTIGTDDAFDFQYPNSVISLMEEFMPKLVVITRNGSDEIYFLLAISGYGTLCPIVDYDEGITINNVQNISIVCKVANFISAVKSFTELLKTWKKLLESEQREQAIKCLYWALSNIDLSILHELEQLQKVVIDEITEFLES